MVIDTHAHLNDIRFSEYGTENVYYKDIINNMQSEGVKRIVTVSYDYESMQKNLLLATENENVYCVLGVHPQDCKNYSHSAEEFMINNAAHNKVVAIGEIGLDYHYDTNDYEIQKDVFIKQIILADKLNLPLVLHIRDAMGDVIDILKAHKQYLNNGFIAHCYSGSVESAVVLLNLGGFISFAGPITYKNGKNLIEVAKSVPLNKILTETDCPYLSPEPLRGKINQPKNTVYVANKLAEILNIDTETMHNITMQNAYSIFKKLK